ncbi:hypothetical protein [Nesterenkonia alkaliphila]|uniref:Uncharacterized protein n=1 Tax=Nesterenkonia alkaliphila TaxID=1463631 RepID=A0A7K1UMI0_9MICC|nr:hypothetical protein [Nesterenkonia alkaliphila]MVT27670.1 hypothetical protein [Nesterenkonia alkaliphila]GFZ87989.1 hypothetical protein GCM10011359_16710 [Nesterenkonia alkaliphila]
MFGKKKKRSHSWGQKLLAGIDTAQDWAEPKLSSAADWAEDTYRKGAPMVQDASARALHAVGDGASVAGTKIKQYTSMAGDGLAAQYDKLPPKAKKEIKKVMDKYDGAKTEFTKNTIPAAGYKLGGYADKTAKLIHKAEVDPRVEKALIKATGDKKIVKKLRKNSEKFAKQASKELKKQQKAKSRKKGLLVFGLVAAGVTAGVAAWRASKPVEDPWKKPEPVSSHTPANSPKPAAQAETNTDAKPTQAEVPAPKPAA